MLVQAFLQSRYASIEVFFLIVNLRNGLCHRLVALFENAAGFGIRLQLRIEPGGEPVVASEEAGQLVEIASQGLVEFSAIDGKGPVLLGCDSHIRQRADRAITLRID